MSVSTECVKVIIRCRPFSSQEKLDERNPVVIMNTKQGEVFLQDPKNTAEPPRTYTFDSVYDPNSKQDNLYLESAYPVVESVLEGYNGTIFAYGQTGTGKTFTMAGEPGELRGVIPRAFEHVFQRIEVGGNKQFLVRASYLEIYNEEIRDLLAKNPKNRLELKEHPDTGVYVKDLSAFVVKQVSEIQEIMDAGQKNRSVGETLMNQDSSRSHSIFTITVETSEYDEAGGNHIRVGKLNLVDLAGSERQSKTGATGDRLKEATKINLSLSALGNVISQLVARAQHISYRDSKLTRLLQDSLGGNTKTVMIANVGPADYNYDETLSTLRYANRAKSIINKPKINEDPKDAMLRQFQEEIQRLKGQLALVGDGELVDGTPIYSAGGAIIQKEIVVEKIVKVHDEQKMKEMEEKLQKQKEVLKKKAEAERKKIEEQKNLAEGEKEKLLEQIKVQEDKEDQEREKQHKLLGKLKAMEAKLLVGTEAMEQAMKQEIQLEKAHKQILKKQEKTERMAENLTKLQEDEKLMEETTGTLQEQIEEKTKKLKSLWTKVQVVNTEVNDTQDEYQREREQLVETVKELTRQLKLKNLAIDYFIPVPELIKLEKRAQWSEERDMWVLPNLQYAGNSLAKQKAKLAKKAQATRLEEDGNLIPPDSQLNVYFAYTDEGAIREEGAQQVQKKSRAKSAKNRPQTAKKANKAEKVVETVGEEGDKPLYPKARGLGK